MCCMILREENCQLFNDSRITMPLLSLTHWSCRDPQNWRKTYFIQNCNLESVSHINYHKTYKCRIYRWLMFALLTLFTVCKSFDSSNLFRHFLHNLINYWKLLPKLWFHFYPVQYFSAAGVIHNIAVGLCSACWNRVIIHFMISEGPDIMHILHPVKLNLIRHFLKHILNH